MLNYILKPLLRKSPYEPKSIPAEEIKNILVVKQHNQMGDILCSLPLLPALRNKFTGANITLVASKDNYSILNSPPNIFFDRLLVYDKSTPKSLTKFFRLLRNRKYEIGIVPSTVSFSHTSHLINFISGARTRVGVRSADGRLNKYEYLLNIKGDYKWNERKLHQIRRNLEIGELIGCSLNDNQFREIRLGLTNEEIKFAEEFFKSNFNDKKLTIGFHPGAGKVQNRWSVENFSVLISKLYSDYGINVLITSGPMDTETLKSIKKSLTEKNISFVNTETIPLRYDAAVISKLDLYITNDTGPMHIANYLHTPLITLFGPTKGYEWGPVFENQKFIQSDSENINDIEVENVFSIAISILKDTKKI